MVKIDLSKSPEENCPSFERCSTNKCPLHKDYAKLLDSPEDKLLFGWKRCRTNKPTRMKIAKAFCLKSLGLTDKERSNLRKSIEMKKQIFLTRVKSKKNDLNNDSKVKSNLIEGSDEK